MEIIVFFFGFLFWLVAVCYNVAEKVLGKNIVFLVLETLCFFTLVWRNFIFIEKCVYKKSFVIFGFNAGVLKFWSI